MILAKTRVMALAIATGRLPLRMPYMSQQRVPAVNKPYIASDIPDVFLVWMVLMAWGKKEMVVPQAARYPMISTKLKCIRVNLTNYC